MHTHRRSQVHSPPSPLPFAAHNHPLVRVPLNSATRQRIAIAGVVHAVLNRHICTVMRISEYAAHVAVSARTRLLSVVYVRECRLHRFRVNSV